MRTTTCPNCRTTWSPVPHTMTAHQGYRTAPHMAVVLDEDTLGRVHGTKAIQSDRWIQTGPSVPMRLADEQTHETVRYIWDCSCGAIGYLVEPRLYQVPCQWRPGPDGVCHVRARNVNPPSDLHVNPRHGGACQCCGQEGKHTLAWGQTASCGATPQVVVPTP